MSDNFVEKQAKKWRETILKSPLTDDTCIALIKCSLDKNCGIPSLKYLHACVNPPPCKGMGMGPGLGLEPEGGQEELDILNDRPWCKNRGLKMGTEEYKKASEEVLRILEQTTRERKKRMEMVTDKEKEEIRAKISDLESIKMKGDNILEHIKESDLEAQYNKIQEDELENRFLRIKEEVSIKEIRDSISVCKPQDRQKKLKEYSSGIQNKKIELEVASNVLEVTRDRFKRIASDMQDGMESRRKGDTPEEGKIVKESRVDEDTTQVLRMIVEGLGKITNRIEDIDSKVEQQNTKQDQVYKLASNIHDQIELQNYVNTWHKSKMELAKKIALMPIKALDIIIWRPAKFAFWHFFGKWFYLAWGALMLLFVVTCGLAAMAAIKQNSPGIYDYFFVIASQIKDIGQSTGSIVLQHLEPWTGEIVANLWSGVKYYSSTSIKYLWDYLIGVIVAIFREVAGQVGTGIASLISWF